MMTLDDVRDEEKKERKLLSPLVRPTGETPREKKKGGRKEKKRKIVFEELGISFGPIDTHERMDGWKKRTAPCT